MIVQLGFDLVWFGGKNHLMRWIVGNMFVHWAKESKFKQTELGSRSKSQMFLGQDRWFFEDLGRLFWWSGLIGININEGLFDPDKEGVDKVQSKEGEIKGSLL